MKEKIEVTPGMFSMAETKPSLKTSLVMLGTTLIVLIGFWLFGKSGDVRFVWSTANDFVLLPDFVMNAKQFCLVGSFVFYLKKKPSPMYLNIVFGFVSLLTLLGWLAAGSRTGVLVYYILSSTVVFAIPLILGGMAGIMSERVGVVNIAIEGQLLTGAFVSSVVGSMTQNLYLGMFAAMIAAALLSM
ncbi:MAG: hypothetical protein RIQ88_905, partial [Actinomycetota bacterium]